MENQIIILKYCLAGLIILSVTSCHRSQFATTSRNYHQGRVTYTKIYHYEGSKASNFKTCKSQVKHEDNQVPAVVNGKNTQLPEITKLTHVHENPGEQMIASTSNEPVLTIIGERTVIPADTPVFSNTSIPAARSGFSPPDTIIKINEPKTGITKIHPADTRKVEKSGLTGFILSVLGLFPIIGLPFAITAMVFGIRSLHKFHKNPTLYKGKGFAIASIILGALGIVVSLLLMGLFVSIAIWGASGGRI